MRSLARIRGRTAIPAIAGLLAAGFITLSVATTVNQHDRLVDQRADRLAAEASDQSMVLENYFARAKGLSQVLAQNAAFRDFYRLPGSRMEKVRADDSVVGEANQALAQIEVLFPGQVGEACFIDDGGAENARAVRGDIAPISALSLDEAGAPFFGPAFALKAGQVYQARPYVSPDTHNWVIANATPVRLPAGQGKAIVHFEVTVESFRDQATLAAGGLDVEVIDTRSGKVVFDTALPQPLVAHKHPGQAKAHVHPLAPLGSVRYPELAAAGPASGKLESDGDTVAYDRVQNAAHNANHWAVVVSSSAGTPTVLAALGAPQVALIVLAFGLLIFAFFSFRSSQSALHDAALTDPLTALANRRKLMADLDAELRRSEPRKLQLLLFDLDGFKAYNDSFGHPAGDALLIRLATAMKTRLAGQADAYRIGGDEFCVLSLAADGDAVLETAADALAERGKGFSITSSWGRVHLPDEAATADGALLLVDQRMYASKGAGRTSAGRQTTDVLVRVIAERYPELGAHNLAVAGLCERVLAELDVPVEDRGAIEQAAALHDIGKIAIPDSILRKPGPLDDDEWEFIRKHTEIGERILASAPALTKAAKLVRQSHERIDGTGYPDKLRGDEIPLGARIIAVCDSFDAITSDRPYSPARNEDEALAELRRCAGSQFDARVVEAFAVALAHQRVPVA